MTGFTSQPSGGFSFGSATSQPFSGFSFGNTTTPASTGFGFGSATSQPSTGFGFGSVTSQPSTGFGFGSSQPSTGFSFGSTTTQPSTGFGFGSATSQPSTGFSFGSTASQPSSTGFGFGTATSQPPFGLGSTTSQPSFGFGSTASQPSFGFGSTTSQPSAGFSFGSTSQKPGFTGLGSTPTTTASGFGSIGTGFGSGGFSFGPSGTSTTPGFSFGSKPATTSGFSFGSTTGGGLFSTPKTTGFGFGTPPQNIFGTPAQQTNIHQLATDPSVALYMAVCAPAYFNDERDEVLKKWNQLQAVWGAGKGFIAPNAPPMEFTPENPFCRFKAVGYIKMPSFSDEDGFVELTLSVKEPEVKQNQQMVVETLNKTFNAQVCVEYVQPLGSDKTRMCIYVQQRQPNGETKKVSAWNVYNYLLNPLMKTTVTNLCIENSTPLVSFTESQLKEYLDSPPRGVDPMIWEQGKRANPDPKKFLPVVMVGFNELKTRFKAQEEENQLLQGQLDLVAEEITQLQGKQATLRNNLEECKRKQLQMTHRILKLVVKQEVERKRGVPIEQGEEQLRMLLEALHSQLSMPTQYMGRLNELLSQISVQQPGMVISFDKRRYNFDSTIEKDLHQYLAWQQDAIKEIVAIVKKDQETIESLDQSIRRK